MPCSGPTRRAILRSSAFALAGAAIRNRAAAQTAPATARLNVAEAVRERVLEQAKAATTAPVVTLAEAKAPGGEPNVFVSELERPSGTRVAAHATQPFREHADALRHTSNNVACLVAAFLLTKEAGYARRAAVHLRAWFVDAGSRMLPEASRAGCEIGSTKGTTTGVVDLVPLAELIRATSFLVDAEGMSADEWTTTNKWFADLGEWLNTDRTAGIARDTKDHRASAWLLINAAIARSQRNDKLLDACRKRLRAPTLRNQLNADGRFPQELAMPDPYRSTLFNFDLLTGVCQLLASPFDLLWDFELQDGPGMRSMVAFVYPVILDPTKWNYVADASHFRDLPGPRPGLLFAGRAYNRPEYVELWRSLDPLPIPEAIGASFPIRQPLLWTARATHGL